MSTPMKVTIERWHKSRAHLADDVRAFMQSNPDQSRARVAEHFNLMQGPSFPTCFELDVLLDTYKG